MRVTELFFERSEKFKEFKEDLDSLECTKLHVDIVHGVKKIRDIVNHYQESQITLYILSDFRKHDWEVSRVTASGRRPKGSRLTSRGLMVHKGEV